MSINEPRVQEAASRLEQVIRSKTGGAPPPRTVLEQRLTALTANAGKRATEGQGYNDAKAKCTAASAPNQAAFLSKLQKLEVAKTPLLQEFVTLLSFMHEDKRGLANIMVAPAGLTNDSSKQTPGPGQAAGRGDAAEVTPLALKPATAALAQLSVQAQRRPQDAGPQPSLSSKRSQDLNGAAMQTPNPTAHYQSNPVYGQEGLNSPLVRTREYTPTLMADGESGDAVRSPLLELGDLLSEDLRSRHFANAEYEHRQLKAVPAWCTQRPRLTGLDALQGLPPSGADDAGGRVERWLSHLTSLPVELQQRIALDHLLYAFMGIPGELLRAEAVPTPDGGAALRMRVAAHGLDSCVHELLQRMLPLCEHIIIVQRFVETRSAFQHGLVHHAVAAHLSGLLQQWLLVVGQLEHRARVGSLSLQALHYYVQQPAATWRLLAAMAAEAAAQQLSAAGLLNLLHAKCEALSGEASARRLMGGLMGAACAPYAHMLRCWLQEGVLHDPYGEFMVQEDKCVTRESVVEDEQLAYWQQRYTLRRTFTRASASGEGAAAEPAGRDVPLFLHSHAETILVTGKYLNTIRECKRTVVTAPGGDAALDYHDVASYVALIGRAHAHASRQLLDLVLGPLDLMGVLTSLKHYFLLDQGDLVVHLLELAKGELRQRATNISRSRLQSLLELAVRTSSVGADRHVERLSFVVDMRLLMEMAKSVTKGVTAGLEVDGATVGARRNTPSPATAAAAAAATVVGGMQPLDRRPLERFGRDAFMLKFSVDWPLSLVVGSGALAQYQLMFKHLFLLKYIERDLAAAWQTLQPTRRLRSGAQVSLQAWCTLCSAMTAFVCEYLRYVTTDVLEPGWRDMAAAVRRAADLDAVIACHSAFLRRVLAAALISHTRILRALVQVEGVLQEFCVAVQRLSGGGTSVPPSPSSSTVAATAAVHGSAAFAGVAAADVAALSAAAADEWSQAELRRLQANFGSAVRAVSLHIGALCKTLRQDGPRAGGAAPHADLCEQVESLHAFMDKLSFGEGM